MTRWPTSGSTTFAAPLHLPQGSLISDFAVVLCDTNPAASSAAVLFGLDILDDTIAIEESLATGDAETPGCVELSTILSGANYVIDNGSNYYVVAFVSPAFDGTTAFRGARVGYQLQVSPAPGVATFADVPTNHGFFKFVEALAAAGITGGCGGGNFCPDSPLTRGQMAVFLSSALGLHWPN